MSLIFLAAATAAVTATPAPSANEARFTACVALVEADVQKAVDEATSWQVVGGGVLARQCLGLAFAAQSRWVPAMAAFQQAATEADKMRDGRGARLWVQAGNAALAATQADKARGYFDVALVSGQLTGAEKGEAHLDRARALVALRQVLQARSDLDEAIKLVPEDPLAWLLSATLARRSSDLARASTDIEQAIKRAPDDPQVALEAGNIALMQGSEAAARTAWAAAVKLAPASAAGKAAAAALKQLDGAVKP